MVTLPDWIEIDDEGDTITIDGICYSRDVFKMLAEEPVGTCLKIESRGDSVVRLSRLEGQANG